jgi:hypothetical protein
MPPAIAEGKPPHEWSFLRKEARLTVEASESEYRMPDDFSGNILGTSVTYVAGSGKRRLGQVAEWEIAAARSKSSSTGDPAYFAIVPEPIDPTSGQRWKMVVWPTPVSSGAVIRYRYILAPNTLSSTQIYPLGGAAHSETLIEAVLSAAEEILDDNGNGVHRERFLERLGASIRLDDELKTQTTPSAEMP